MKTFQSLASICLLFILGFTSIQVHANSLDDIINGDHRSDANIARNQYRHPKETLEFFDVQPNMAVLEVWPGGGWYSEILGPYLRDNGQFYAGHFSSGQSKPFFQKMRQRFTDKVSANKAIYGNVIINGLHPPSNDTQPAPKNEIDRVLTFRNVHNWSKAGYDQEMFKVFFDVLKPGGILGVVEHRATPNTNFQAMIETGYMTEEYVITLAKQAGFELVGKSEINANPKDLKNYTNGVWSLPPTLRGKDKRREEYVRIGESDRMTLKFRKP